MTALTWLGAMPGGRPAYAICMCAGGAPVGGGALPAADVVGAGPDGSGAAPGSAEVSGEAALPSAPAAAPLYCAGSAYGICDSRE